VLTFQNFASHLGILAEIIILPQISPRRPTLASQRAHSWTVWCVHAQHEFKNIIPKYFAHASDFDKQCSAGSEPDWLGEAATSGYHAANFIGYSLHRPGERSIYIAYNPYKYPMQIDIPDAPNGKDTCRPHPHNTGVTVHNGRGTCSSFLVHCKVGRALAVPITVCTGCQDSIMHCSYEWCMRLACCPATA